MSNFFSKVVAKLRREPVLLTQGVALALSGAAAWRLPLSDEQSLWITAVAVFVAAVIGRSKVKPMVDVAASQPAPGEPLEAGPASDVKDGEEVDVVPTDPLS